MIAGFSDRDARNERSGCGETTDRHAPKPAIAIERSTHGCTPTKEAAALRRDLKLAGITRAQLFERSEHIEPVRFHDLRASFVTWARRAGKDSGWISDRSGHLTHEVMQRYDRGARSLADLQLVPFPDISDAIPEPRNVRALVRSPKG